MKIFLSIIKVIAIVIIAVTITLFTGAFLMQDRVAGYVLKSLNKNLATKFSFESVRLSFLRKFPMASLDLENAVVLSSPGFDRTCFGGINTDTLLTAETVSMDFSITDIINGIYNIGKIGIKNGSLMLYSDTSGFVNYEITAEDTIGSDTGFTINLDKITLSAIEISYNNQATKLLLEGLIETGRLKSRISGDEIDFTALAGINITRFKLYDFSVSKNIFADLDLSLFSSDKGIMFNSSTLKFENYNFGLSGFVSAEDVLDLKLTGENIDITGMKNYLPEKFNDRIAPYDPSGTLNIQAYFRGPLTRTANPGIEIVFKLENGQVSYLNSALNINDLSFDGHFSNGPEMTPKTSSMLIENFSGTLGTADYSGTFEIARFDSLFGQLSLKGNLIPAEIKEFFNLKEISSTSGMIDFNLNLKGYVPEKESYSLSDLLNLNPAADLKFNSFSLGLRNDRIKINNIKGDLNISDTATARNLKFSIDDQDFELNGSFIHLPSWLAGKSVALIGIADISCNNLHPESFISARSSNDSTPTSPRAISLPGGIYLDLDFDIKDFTWKTFTAGKVAGSVTYKPRIVNFKSIIFSSLDGIISGNGFLVQNADKSFISRGSFNLEKININTTFTAFKNFGQGFLKAENLDGSLSGTLSVLIPLDSLMQPVIKSVTAEGKYLLTDGVLKDFDPVKELSSFIEISELENISFEQIENDFFIRNNILYIPQMDLKSSAADLSVNGRHSFDNTYEYHVKVLLSEILSKKIKKPKPNTTEFGSVKDDGLGRTSLLLKIESKNDVVKVGYDMKAAGSQIKNDIKTERQSLKTILNQEYGWFKNDSTPEQKNTSGTRFRISWGEDADTTQTKTESGEEKSVNPLKTLFKKK
jgi:hypothetical protein